MLPKTYSSAKNECLNVLAEHQAEMEQIAVDALQSDQDVRGDFKDYRYRYDTDSSYVTFSVDAQGFLGGQYWDLVYTKDGRLYHNTESYFYKETKGNNIVKAERIDEHWWYLWTDYDGIARSYQ